MDSSLKAPTNHYETLGLTSAATAAEIAQAFARKMGAFAARPLVAAAELSIAFETLRDPERRRAYDASLRPPPLPPPQQPAYTVRWNSGPFVTAAVPVPPARPSQAEPRSKAAIEKPFIASPEPVSIQAPEISPAPAPQAQECQPQPRPEPFIEQQRAIPRAIERAPAAEPESPTGLNRIAIVVGGVVAGVGVLGAVAGWSAGLVEQPQQPEAQVTTPLARAKPLTTVAAAEPAPAWTVAQALPQRPRPTAAARVGRSSSAPRALPLEELQAEASQSALDQSGSAVAETPTAAVVPASLSLPNPIIARTIGRIGYPCGEVASTTPVDGGRGVFKVTCTSGHSYQAALVRGRYHFRRWGNR